jgi:hypothetical protein
MPEGIAGAAAVNAAKGAVTAAIAGASKPAAVPAAPAAKGAKDAMAEPAEPTTERPETAEPPTPIGTPNDVGTDIPHTGIEFKDPINVIGEVNKSGAESSPDASEGPLEISFLLIVLPPLSFNPNLSTCRGAQASLFKAG